VNREYADRVLADYRASVEQAQTLQKTKPIWSVERQSALKAADRMVPQVNAVLRGLVPDIEPIQTGYVAQHLTNLSRLYRAQALIGTWKAMTVQGPDGAEVVPPDLPFWAMDPICCSAASLWEKGKYRLAVNDAAGKLNELTQKRLGRNDISDRALMAMAFNPKGPEKGRPRLRCPGDPNTDTVKSLQEGAHLTAMGCMLAIRNPATHETGNGNPIICAEQLATLSMVARLVRNWIPERYIEPIDRSTSPLLSAAYQELLRQQRAAVQLSQQQRSALPQGTPTGSPTAD